MSDSLSMINARNQSHFHIVKVIFFSSNDDNDDDGDSGEQRQSKLGFCR